jgi:hypothetical protein
MKEFYAEECGDYGVMCYQDITNLYNVPDGIYDLQTTNHSRDWDYILKEYNA